MKNSPSVDLQYHGCVAYCTVYEPASLQDELHTCCSCLLCDQAMMVLPIASPYLASNEPGVISKAAAWLSRLGALQG